jgi:1-deoxy-D-xylulose-5-phosphate synthase
MIDDLSQITDTQAEQLCQQLRERLIVSVSKTGGHLASNLGVVELTVAIHRVFDTDQDRLVFDVGHQCYSHKILTGRDSAMDTLRTFGGLSGFPKPNENKADAFIAGHASNSVSVALGMARARTILQEDYSVLALIGDGALTGGLAYEGLTNAGQSGEPLIVILNDNGMSITPNVGSMADYLAHQRLKPQYLRFKKVYRSLTSHGPLGRGLYRVTHVVKQAVKDAILQCSMFEEMGFAYVGPVDGHDVKELTHVLRYAKDLACPVLVHVKTTKGKGYPPAEDEPDRFHGVGPFDLETGKSLKSGGKNFSAVFGETMCALAERDERICGITAAMQSGTGLTQFAQRYPNRFFDVGIAEGHAVTMAGGMAKQRTIPVFAVYSTFLQRSYDMLLHDVALQNLHVVFAVDRAGLVGDDGETHHGVFDVAFLSTIPGMTILCPSSFDELRLMLEHAVLKVRGPVAVRYPRGGEGSYTEMSQAEGTCVLRDGSDVTIITYGTMVNEAITAAELLAEQGVSARLLKLNSIRPLDMEPILQAARQTRALLVAEECVSAGCVGQQIACRLLESHSASAALSLVNLGDQFVTHGTVPQLRQLCGIDGRAIFQKAMEVLGRG